MLAWPWGLGWAAQGQGLELPLPPPQSCVQSCVVLSHKENLQPKECNKILFKLCRRALRLFSSIQMEILLDVLSGPSLIFLSLQEGVIWSLWVEQEGWTEVLFLLSEGQCSLVERTPPDLLTGSRVLDVSTGKS